jgi:hypothetical protein
MEKDKMAWACSTNAGKEGRVWVIGRKARRKETTRKTKTSVGE